MSILEKNSTVKTQEKREEKGKELTFSLGYFIYKDGRCYSEKTNRFLIKQKNKGKTANKYYYSYDLRPYGRCLVSRLVMFVYGKHNYETIKEMPKIIHIDGDQDNLDISNLKFATQSEINKINNITPPPSCYVDKGTIKVASKRIVENLLEQQLTYKKISEIFDTSEMAVYRFVKKHIKEQV